jgi:hypothetical protein
MRLVYVAHPLGSGSDREENRRNAALYVAAIGELGFAPVADWIILSGMWSEEKRDMGLAIDFALIGRCDELWLVGPRISPGMAAEASHARAHDIDVLDFVGLLPSELAKRVSATTR